MPARKLLRTDDCWDDAILVCVDGDEPEICQLEDLACEPELLAALGLSGDPPSNAALKAAVARLPAAICASAYLPNAAGGYGARVAIDPESGDGRLVCEDPEIGWVSRDDAVFDLACPDNLAEEMSAALFDAEAQVCGSGGFDSAADTEICATLPTRW